jgi:hypothetical protein
VGADGKPRFAQLRRYGLQVELGLPHVSQVRVPVNRARGAFFDYVQQLDPALKELPQARHYRQDRFGKLRSVEWNQKIRKHEPFPILKD